MKLIFMVTEGPDRIEPIAVDRATTIAVDRATNLLFRVGILNPGEKDERPRWRQDATFFVKSTCEGMGFKPPSSGWWVLTEKSMDRVKPHDWFDLALSMNDRDGGPLVVLDRPLLR